MNIADIKKTLKKNEMLFSKYGVKLIGVFGSYVREEEDKNSDIDILIDISKGSNVSLLSLAKLENEISDIFNKKVDIAIKRSLKKNIDKNILNEVVPV